MRLCAEQMLLLAMLPVLSLQATEPVPCGKPATAPDETILGNFSGAEAVPHSWPWTISLRISGSHFCSGSIYSENWIITAARCVNYTESQEFLSVEAGRHCINCNESSQQSRKVAKIVLHPGYSSSSETEMSANDLALLQVDRPFIFNSAVSPICLPTSPLVNNAVCFVVGWGSTRGNGENVTEFLNQAAQPIVPNPICTDTDHYDSKVTDNMLCAGPDQGGIDFCLDDFGSPLMGKTDGVWYLHGLSAYGEGCDVLHRPGVFTRVKQYADWIKETAV